MTESIFEMFDWLAAYCDLPQSALDDLPHLVFSVQDCSCLFVLINVNFKLVKEFFVHLLIFVNQGEHLVDFTVELFVGIDSNEMFLSEPFFFRHDIIKFKLLGSDIGLNSCQSVIQLFSFSDFIGQVGSIIAGLDFIAVSLLH